MSPRLGCLLAATFLLAAASTNAFLGGDAAKKELELLQGDWIITFHMNDGRERSKEEVQKEKVVIKGNKMTVTGGGKEEAFDFTIDPTKTPKTIKIFEDAKNAFLFIYELKGDTLRIGGRLSSTEQSKDFPAMPYKDGDVLLVLQRAKGQVNNAVGDKDKDGYVALFDGKSLKGWHASAQSGHSKTSKNKSGGRWVVEDGVIVGSQDVPGNGGILITDEQFTNFEIVLEMKNDFGPDSGLFLRTNEKGQCYQAMIDYHADGNLMGIYGEGIGGKPHVKNFKFLKDVTDIQEEKCDFKLPVSPKDWPTFWKHGEWNELKARITGNPPTITTWIKGVKFMEFTDTEKRLPDRGGIGLQVHGGGDWTKQFVRYRNLKIKALD